MNNENSFQFKDFIYLNTDFLESFTAQKYKGFPKEMQIASIQESSEEKNGEKVNRESNVNGNIKVGLFGVNGEHKETTEGKQFNQINTETSQNVMIKVHKDNMYHSFFEYINNENLLLEPSSNLTIGKYIQLNETFYYIDFSRIQKLCSENYRTIYPVDNIDTEFSYDRFNEIRNKIELLKELIPFDALLYSKDFIVLIDQDWLRIKKEHLGYILDGNISVVGRINKVLQVHRENAIPEVIKILNEFQEYAISLLRELGFLTSDKVYIVSPIAIYR